MVPRTGTKFSDRAFLVTGRAIWNSISEPIRAADNILCFKRQLNTHFLTFSTDFIVLRRHHAAIILTVSTFLTLFCLARLARVRWALNTFH